MQLPRVQILQELVQAARSLHVLVVGEQVHVPEGVDGDQRQVRERLAQVMQRVLEPLPVRCQEVHVLWKLGRVFG